ncbi:hypothetical protein [Streptosporangium sp. NPDC000396]|uniref:RNA polymerase sigma factor n=1 Tax=Streptosporangium sp. NPDC000396 TaxID=3366185 RepID=UPI00367CA37D
MTQPLIGQRSRGELIAELYDRHAAGLFAYCHDQLGDPGSAADVLVAVLTAVPDVEPPRAALYALARREIYRRDVLYTPPRAYGDPASAFVERVLRDLRPHQREVLFLSGVCEMTVTELAWVLDVAADTADELTVSACRRFAQSLTLSLASVKVPDDMTDVFGALATAPIRDVLVRAPWAVPPVALRTVVLGSPSGTAPAPASPILQIKQLWPTTPAWPLPLAETDPLTNTSLFSPPAPSSLLAPFSPPDPDVVSAHEAVTEPMPKLKDSILTALDAGIAPLTSLNAGTAPLTPPDSGTTSLTPPDPATALLTPQDSGTNSQTPPDSRTTSLTPLDSGTTAPAPLDPGVAPPRRLRLQRPKPRRAKPLPAPIPGDILDDVPTSEFPSPFSSEEDLFRPLTPEARAALVHTDRLVAAAPREEPVPVAFQNWPALTERPETVRPDSPRPDGPEAETNAPDHATTGETETTETAKTAETAKTVKTTETPKAAEETAAEETPEAVETLHPERTGGRARRRHKLTSHRNKLVKRVERHHDWVWELIAFLICVAIAITVFFAVPTIVTP